MLISILKKEKYSFCVLKEMEYVVIFLLVYVFIRFVG